MLLKAEDDGSMRGIQVNQNGSCINRLFFANDTLLFFINNFNDAKIVRDMLHEFECASGQKINLTKYTLYFSPNA